MDFKEISAGTPQLLKTCLNLFDNNGNTSCDLDDTFQSTPTKLRRSKHLNKDLGEGNTSNDILASEKYSKHPDIQFFRQIKNKHHFAYHRAKRQTQSLDKIKLRMTVFDPYNRDYLLERLSTFTALNWNIPYTSLTEVVDHKSPNDLNELKCAQNGWKCISISINNNTKNHLICTSCNQQIMLKFNNLGQILGSPFEFDLEDYNELNNALKYQYLDQIVKSGHDSNCAWINFETPIEGVYYLRPHLKSTDEILINDYCKNLMNLIDNNQVLLDNALFLSKLSDNNNNDVNSPLFDKFTKITNLWILNRYFGDVKENFSEILNLTPKWLYLLAMFGWDLNIQSFDKKLVLLLICSKCNQRVFLDSTNHTPIDKHDFYGVSPSTNIYLSSSKILTPCKFPPEIPLTDSDESIENDDFDLIKDHKSWCCNIQSYGTESFRDYFINMIVSSERYIGNNGEFDYDADMSIEIDETSTISNRKRSFDVNEGLDRLNKLRKLYLIDE